MGYADAIDDGIRIVEGRRNCYYIPCEICRREIRRTQYSRKRTYICDYCKGVIKKKEKILISEELKNTKTRREKQFDKAIDEIKKQCKNFDEYEKAISIARQRVELYGSTPEAMVAIELIKLGYNIIPQQKVGKYKVDFAIPSEKIIIEVDGEIYHKDINKGDREAVIQLSFGLEWRIIHIPAEKISKNIKKLKNVIEAFKK